MQVNLQVSTSAASTVPPRGKYVTGSLLSRTAPKHPEVRGVPADKAATSKKARLKFKKPAVKGLPKMDVLMGKLDFEKYRDPTLRKHFKEAQVVGWYNVNGEAALVVGIYEPIHKEAKTRFVQFTKSGLNRTLNPLAKYMRAGGSIEVLVGANHLLFLTYAA